MFVLHPCCCSIVRWSDRPFKWGQVGTVGLPRWCSGSSTVAIRTVALKQWWKLCSRPQSCFLWWQLYGDYNQNWKLKAGYPGILKTITPPLRWLPCCNFRHCSNGGPTFHTDQYGQRKLLLGPLEMVGLTPRCLVRNPAEWSCLTPSLPWSAQRCCLSSMGNRLVAAVWKMGTRWYEHSFPAGNASQRAMIWNDLVGACQALPFWSKSCYAFRQPFTRRLYGHRSMPNIQLKTATRKYCTAAKVHIMFGGTILRSSMYKYMVVPPCSYSCSLKGGIGFGDFITATGQYHMRK